MPSAYLRRRSVNGRQMPLVPISPTLCRLLGVTSDDLIIGKQESVRLVPAEKRKDLDDLALRIRVLSVDGDKVCVNLPMPIIKIALEIGADAIPNVSGSVGQTIRQIDFGKIVELAECGVLGKIVDIESADGDKVEVVVE